MHVGEDLYRHDGGDAGRLAVGTVVDGGLAAILGFVSTVPLFPVVIRPGDFEPGALQVVATGRAAAATARRVVAAADGAIAVLVGDRKADQVKARVVLTHHGDAG